MNLPSFLIEDYDLKKPFSSFLPGVAGKMGIPIWAFYVNRGQGIASFGTKDKNGSILEFNPACIAYEKIATNGFRTFIKINNQIIEPFSPTLSRQTKRTMTVTSSSFTIKEVNHEMGYSIEIKYFGLPNSCFGALSRRVKFTNISTNEFDLEILDGITQLLPKGITNGAYKEVGNLMRSWMEVKHLDKKVPFFTMRSSSSDEAEIHLIEDGNFYLAKDENNELLSPIVDFSIIFNHDTSKQFPYGFKKHSIKELFLLKQLPFNKVPCAFVGKSKHLLPNKQVMIDTLIGTSSKYELIEEYLKEIMEKDFFPNKAQEMDEIIKNLVQDVETKTSYEHFDAYLKQSYLDNFLRGGYPVNLGTADLPIPYYLYSRKHGDPERDYNWFVIEPEYYSQGNGNYRDINQNRRNDTLLHPFIKDFNIKLFMNLIQMDGYNPLVINGSIFSLKDKNDLPNILKYITGNENSKLGQLLEGIFSPGAIINKIINEKIKTIKSIDEILSYILNNSNEHQQATFGEGYWVDHFSYNLDLIENFLIIYPDLEKKLLFDDKTYRFFQSPVDVLPKDKKYGLTSKGHIRQYGSLSWWSEEENVNLNWHKTLNNQIYQTSLIAKLISLITIKFATLDPLGYGIQMEANKPGWNDAMNGLPGIFGSGVSEAIELLRFIDFIINKLTNSKEIINIYEELNTLLNQIEENIYLLKQNQINQFIYWNKTTDALEQYRTFIRKTITGKEIKCKSTSLLKPLSLMHEYLINKLNELIDKYDIIPTYFTYEVGEYEVIDQLKRTPYGLIPIRPIQMKERPLPYFLEAPARFLKISNLFKNYDLRKRYKTIKESDIYDSHLKMYKTSGDLDQEKMEIGRIRAFTKGWLERESNFMHMNFKYLLGLLKSGLYEEFFNDLKTNLPPFFDPIVYGRSLYENSTFIASSNNPDDATHGQGHIARLSGSNTEVINMWSIMMFGKKPFKMEDNTLTLTLKPILPQEYFKDGIVKTKFLGKIDIIYQNYKGLNTFNKQVSVKRYELVSEKDKKTVSASKIIGQDAYDVRNLKYSQITVVLE